MSKPSSFYISMITSSPMLAIRQQACASRGPEPTRWFFQRGLNLPKNGALDPWYRLRRRQITSSIPTCGFRNGDPDQARTAESGLACRYDPGNALWGFCSTSISSVSDCSFAAGCIDSYDCANGCGKETGRITITWYEACCFPFFCLLAFPVLALVVLCCLRLQSSKKTLPLISGLRSGDKRANLFCLVRVQKIDFVQPRFCKMVLIKDTLI